ncbi:putative forkhead domain-containing protein [Diaporthe ampelina]|uniref:Putative forkhead domain-containing protein n=1 Tax=Diaporthe ampelina TaxID=1214573 RepID=A0A0G2FML5_9PEZI|nr:putative forkhead domain-containing protein [Diaporthe ampelina]
MGNEAICIGREDTAPLSDPEIDMDADIAYDPILYDAEDVLGSRSSTEPAGGKSDEPYARLIYRAFMSRPNKSMTLQEIYQWFRENTDKAKSKGKGWQNSIRHNLSMNGAFTKRSSNQPALNSDGSLSLDASGADGRKSTEWFLEPRYYDGVQSTTRYRKGNSKSAGRAHRGRERKLNSNKKQLGSEINVCSNIQASHDPNRQTGKPPGRQSKDINYFQLQIVENAHGAHGKELSSDVDPAAEPTTPTCSGHDSQVDDLSYGNKYHPYLPGFFANTDGGYHHPAAALSPPVYPQQSGYTLQQVEGIFEPPSGIEAPLFLSGNSLTSEEAAALMAGNPSWANTGPYCG